jgi:hypothetical protein
LAGEATPVGLVDVFSAVFFEVQLFCLAEAKIMEYDGLLKMRLNCPQNGEINGVRRYWWPSEAGRA